MHISVDTSILENRGKLVIEIEGRTNLSADSLLVDVGCEQFHDVEERLTILIKVVAGIERICVVCLDVGGDNRRLVAVSLCHRCSIICVLNRRSHFLVAGNQHSGSCCQRCKEKFCLHD